MIKTRMSTWIEKLRDAQRKALSPLPWGLRFAAIVVPLVAGTWLFLLVWNPTDVPRKLEWPAKLVLGLAAGVVIAALGLLVSRDR